MKKNLLNISSVLDNGLGGTNPGFLCLIYTFLLQEFNLDFYNFIFINQIGIGLEEMIVHEQNNVYINIRYPLNQNFNPNDTREKYRTCLDIIHAGLLRLAEQDKRMDISKLDSIKHLIIKNKFSFDLGYKKYRHNRDKDFVATLIIHPEENNFDFYILIEQKGIERCKLLIYQGIPTDYYIDDLFYYGNWIDLDEFVVNGKRSEIEFRVKVNTCSIELINTSKNKNNAPLFSLFRSNAGSEELQDYIKSLPPSIAAIITYEPN